MTEKNILIPRIALEERNKNSLTLNELYLYSWLYMRRIDIRVNHEPFVETSIDMIHNLTFTFSRGNESRNKSSIRNILIPLVEKGYIETSTELESVKYSKSFIVIFKNYNTSFNIPFSVFEGIGSPKELYENIATRYGLREIKENRSSESGYENWRSQVLTNDNYTCQVCNISTLDQPDLILHAHHKDGYEWCVIRRTDPTNGATLCDGCHTEFHVLYGYGRNTEQQYIEFYEMKKSPVSDK